MIKTSLFALALSLGFAGAAQAGCLSGAVAGGVIGHMAGHHGLAGAAVGCAVGHHREAKAKRDEMRNTAPNADPSTH